MLNFERRRSCPGCRSQEDREIFRCDFDKDPIAGYLKRGYGDPLPLSQGTYVLRKCLGCGLIFQGEILTEEALKAFYEKWSCGPPSLKLDVSKEIEALQEILALVGYFNTPPQTLSLFDFGMGDGEWASLAQALGCRAFGYDLSSARVAKAAARGVTVLAEEQIDSFEFDVIHTDQVMEHVAHPLETLLRLKARLKPGGLLKISVPNGRRIEKKLAHPDWRARKGSRRDLNPIAPLEHINCFDYHSLVAMGNAAGLKPVRLPLSLQYHYTLRWNTWKWFRKNLIKPLKRNFLSRGTYLFFTTQ